MNSQELHVGVGGLLLVALILVSSVEGEAIGYAGPPCIQLPQMRANCVGSIPSAVDGVAPTVPFDLNLNASSSGGLITDTIQGSMTFALDSSLPNFQIGIRTWQVVVPSPGAISFGNFANIYIWADQPLESPIFVTGTACTSFGFVGECFSSNDALVPFLGDDPDLANAAVLHLGAGDSACGPGCAFPPGDWINRFTLSFGSSGPAHLRFVVDAGATFHNATLAPEPSALIQTGIGGLAFMAIAYSRRRRLRAFPAHRG